MASTRLVQAEAGSGEGQVSDWASQLGEEAKKDYWKGRKLYEENEMELAFKAFASAYESSRDPRLIWNMALCARGMRHFAHAKRLVKEYVKDARSQNVLSPQDEATADAFVKAVSGRVVTAGFSLAPKDAVVLIDGEVLPPVPEPASRDVDVGSHHVEVQAKGFRTQAFRQSFELGKPNQVDVSLEPEGAPVFMYTASGNSIHVDGRTVGTGAWSGTLTPGSHVLEVRDPVGNLERREVYLQDREKRILELWPSRSVAPWVWAMGAFVVGLAFGSAGALILENQGVL
ncbi:MAG: hypothetical protein SF187_27755 [Deltaproteobacteria bacterium]|nr:hypothetical protein [Deltaproteobacteria bacterium]